MKDIEAKLHKDPCSYSEPDRVSTSHIDIDWEVDFEKKIFFGSVLLHLSIKDSSLQQLVLDSNELRVDKVVCEDSGQLLKFNIGDHDPNFGAKFTIHLPAIPEDNNVKVRIFYGTSGTASGLTWMLPELTSGKKFPFVFSQCQPIHARSILPCQDTPSVKATYTSSVKCPSHVVALMSALRKGEDKQTDNNTVYKFHQPAPIPSYLLAIVVGDLVSQDIGPRSKVWAEKELVEKAAYEFADTEKMISIAESICGPYVWTQYDLLILPPSFPYGGMENPCLTFVTPTLLAGDRSLADVVAHEISHSWTGNLVTNCNWEHFWLNEGFTTFVQRKIEAKLSGDVLTRHLSAIEGWESLKSCIKTRGENDPLTCLVPNLDGVNPDDAFSSVPYEKGHTLLWYLENLVGGSDEFDPFLKSYLAKFRGQSIDSNQFLEFLYSYFPGQEKTLRGIDWNLWFKTPGMPPYEPSFDTTLVDSCVQLTKSWDEWDPTSTESSFTGEDLKNFSSNQIIVWLTKSLAHEFPLEKVKKMADIYKMDDFTNFEIRFAWLRICLKARWPAKVDAALEFVNCQGRMKFVRPIYRDLYAWEEYRQKAQDNFVANKVYMAFVSAYTLAKDLHLSDNK